MAEMREKDVYGTIFIEDAPNRRWTNLEGIRKVQVFSPSSFNDNSWRIITEYGQVLDFTGKDAEDRAFCVAEGLTRQT